MRIADYVLIFLITLGVINAGIYIYRQKKAGKCIGCSGNCSSCGRVCDKKGKPY